LPIAATTKSTADANTPLPDNNGYRHAGRQIRGWFRRCAAARRLSGHRRPISPGATTRTGTTSGAAAADHEILDGAVTRDHEGPIARENVRAVLDPVQRVVRHRFACGRPAETIAG
jgi:hypothetical protein